MTKESYQTGDAPFIHVERCDGELIIRGWAEPSLRIQGEHELSETEKGFHVSAEGSLKLVVPERAIVSVGWTGGNLIIKRLSGPAAIETVRGNLSLIDGGDVSAETVHGNLRAKHSRGTLEANRVHGDAVIRDGADVTLENLFGDLAIRKLRGNLMVKAVSGDVNLRGVEGDATIASCHRDVNLSGSLGQVNISGVKGDIRLRGGLQDGAHTLEATGDIVIRWPAGQPLNLVAMGGQIDNRLPLEDVVEKNGSLAGHMGQGNTHLTVTTSGRLILKEDEPEKAWAAYDDEAGDMEFEFGVDMAGISSRIETEISNHLSRITRDLEGKFGTDFAERMSGRVAQKANRMAERARRREFRGRASGNDFTTGPMPPKPAASTEEQLKILKMVENGKITPQEASMLLEALEA